MDASNIKVIPAEIGGGFGGKTTVYLEPLALLFSKKTGKPVKMTMNRSEVLRATGPTSGSYIRCKIGATKDGKITAAQVWMAYEAGAFPGTDGIFTTKEILTRLYKVVGAPLTPIL